MGAAGASNAEAICGSADCAEQKIQVNKSELFYSGISQGGIFGGTFMAVTPDMTYGHLGVPGNNYNTCSSGRRTLTVLSRCCRRPIPIR